MSPQVPIELEEEFQTLTSFLNHKGWTEYLMPTVMLWQASAMNKWLSDVGDKKESNDLLRGQVIAYKQVLKHFRDRLVEVSAKLEEARTGKPSEVETNTLPPI